MFDNGTATTLRFFGRQTLPASGDVRAWLSGGFPDYDSWVGISGERIQAAGGLLGFHAGDFQVGSLLPDLPNVRIGDSYALRGFGARLSRGASNWAVFGGESRYALEVPGQGARKSELYGAEYQGRWKRSSIGGGLTVIRNPVHADPDLDASSQAVLSGRLFRGLAPRVQVFGEGLATLNGDLGYRAGLRFGLQNGELAASLYGFGDGFPFVYPLYRPGEQGLELRGRYRPSELSWLTGSLYYASDELVRNRTELRGNIGFGLGFGSNRPSLFVSYSHDDVVMGSLTTEDRAYLADRLAVTLSRHTVDGHLTATLEHVANARGDALDRSQAFVTYRRLLGLATYLDGSLVAQQNELSDLGMTVESSVERPLRGRYYYLTGLGLAFVDRQVRTAGEGVLRLGLTRRMYRSGWYVRAELRLPFSIGLERSELNRQVVALDVGNRFEWPDLRTLREALPGGRRRDPTGAIEGSVTVNGEGLGGLTVLIDGVPRAVTRSDGSYRIHGVPVGTTHVNLDLRSLDPGYEPVGEASRAVDVAAKGLGRADFAIARFSSLQGALLVCENTGTVSASGVVVRLEGGGLSRTTRTSNLGGFQFDRLPPGVYELSLDPGSDAVPRLAGPVRIDLTNDIFGWTLRLDCP